MPTDDGQWGISIQSDEDRAIRFFLIEKLPKIPEKFVSKLLWLRKSGIKLKSNKVEMSETKKN